MLAVAEQLGIWLKNNSEHLRERERGGRKGLIMRVWNRKGDVHDPGKCRGITLLNHMLKLLKRILDGKIRAVM